MQKTQEKKEGVSSESFRLRRNGRGGKPSNWAQERRTRQEDQFCGDHHAVDGQNQNRIAIAIERPHQQQDDKSSREAGKAEQPGTRRRMVSQAIRQPRLQKTERQGMYHGEVEQPLNGKLRRKKQNHSGKDDCCGKNNPYPGVSFLVQQSLHARAKVEQAGEYQEKPSHHEQKDRNKGANQQAAHQCLDRKQSQSQHEQQTSVQPEQPTMAGKTS